MRKVTHLHGMTASAFNAWRKQTPKNQSGVISPWTCSDRDGYTYLWNPDNLVNLQECEEYNALEYTESRAYESAVIQAAVNQDNKIYILFLDLSDITEDIESDQSCENMPDTECIPEDMLTRERVLYAHEYKFNIWHSPYVIARLLDNPQFNSYQLEENLENISRHLAKTNADYPDEIYSLGSNPFVIQQNEI